MIDLELHRVAPDPIWESLRFEGDGYDRMYAARPYGWLATASWGNKGWDLGGWPYVVVFERRSADAFEVAINVEGDATQYSFASREDANSALDQIAFFNWKVNGESWVDGLESPEQMPAELRGPYEARVQQGVS